MRFRTRIALSAPDDVVRITMHRNLCEMRDHDDLMSAGEMRDDLGEGHGNSAAHAGINLVKHERVDIVICSQYNLDSTRLTSPPDAIRASGRACMPAPGR